MDFNFFTRKANSTNKLKKNKKELKKKVGKMGGKISKRKKNICV